VAVTTSTYPRAQGVLPNARAGEALRLWVELCWRMREPSFNETLQIGMVVRDLETAMRRYVDDYGIGPWDIYRGIPVRAVESWCVEFRSDEVRG
jgi:hypothetical protein